MTNPTWTWANLTGEQRQLLAEAEKALGADYLLAYQHPASGPTSFDGSSLVGLETAHLTESQIDYLRRLEDQLHAVVIAYRKHDS